MNRKKINFKKISLLLSSIAGGFIFFREKINEIFSSTIITDIYAIIDIFLLEIILLIFLLIFYEKIIKIFIDFYKSLKFISSNKNFKNEAHVKYKILYFSFFSFILLLTLSISYTSYKIVQGKYIYVTNYHRALIEKAENSFETGKIEISKKHLHTCINILKNERCRTRLESLNSRFLTADLLKELNNHTGNRNLHARIKLTEDIYYLTKDSEYNNLSNRSIFELFMDAGYKYSSAINMIKDKNYRDARDKLNELNSKIPGYNATTTLIKEIEKIINSRNPKINKKNYPFVYYAINYDIDSFIEITSHGHDSLIEKYKKKNNISF